MNYILASPTTGKSTLLKMWKGYILDTDEVISKYHPFHLEESKRYGDIPNFAAPGTQNYNLQITGMITNYMIGTPNPELLCEFGLYCKPLLVTNLTHRKMLDISCLPTDLKHKAPLGVYVKSVDDMIMRWERRGSLIDDDLRSKLHEWHASIKERLPSLCSKVIALGRYDYLSDVVEVVDDPIRFRLTRHGQSLTL